ncbi:PilZ domain-containing protein [Myxococcus landrumensis]|uniref:PilZ domain-containing protein n=1 Tax=Myxococcus landrumensis TaxID=2813577 RepID=A0ABX7N0Y1_9BACT|nr:PilZ domain-containing protein [Myxococcus landrumus]QSQ11377.1 PilZ domain-containing protein [Myxococcus landrumus]
MRCELCLSEHAADARCPHPPHPRRPSAHHHGTHPPHGQVHLASHPWNIRVHRPQGLHTHGVDIDRGGLFLSCEEPFPPLFTRLELTLHLAGEDFSCTGEVVRHVDAAHALTWGSAAGIGIQLLPAPPRLRELLSRARASPLTSP